MDADTRAAFAALEASMNRWFELSQAQHMELRSSMDRQFTEVRQDLVDVQHGLGQVRQDISRIETRLNAFYDEFCQFRDWVVEQFADVRAALRQLTQRVERLERQSST